MLCAGQDPDFSFARPLFAVGHLEALWELFVVAFRLCAKAGLVSLGRFAVDGSKLGASGSRHRAMS